MKVWERARNSILGGNSLLSKSPDSILPGLWPSHYKRATGCIVEDFRGREYYDFSNMGVGSCILGYAFDDVDAAVREAIECGVMSSLNCIEEVELAELLLRLDPWAGKVRFARTGGEALSIAVRLARAATKRSRVVVSGYHGWHDWYLSANLSSNESLNGYLIPGLAPRGIPEEMAGLTQVNDLVDLDRIQDILAQRQTAAVVMEVARFAVPDEELLKNIRAICDATGTLLIFDECTSGFRETLGGMHASTKVNPDICTYGKAIANGYALTAITMSDHVAHNADGVFISSTFWTERVGPAAALATVKFLEKYNVPSSICKVGASLKKELNRILVNEKTDFSFIGLNSLPCFHSDDPSDRVALTKILLSKNILFSGTIYLSYSHKKQDLDFFIKEMELAVKTLKSFSKERKHMFTRNHMPNFRLGRVTHR